ncbi:MAG: hypothetical protein ACPGF7_06575, partial [Pontibacterium sp.]
MNKYLKEPHFLSAEQRPSGRSVFCLKSIFMGALLGSLLTACCQDAEQGELKSAIIPVLSPNNIGEFSESFAHDYFNTLESLENAFDAYENTEDTDAFITFRNREWTPLYIKNKAYYQAVLHKNKATVYRASIDPLFTGFDRLVVIGLDLKHAALENNNNLRERAFLRIATDTKAVKQVLSSTR